MLLGVSAAIIFAIAQGDFRGKVIGGAISLLVVGVGYWLTRRVEKRFSKVVETILDIIFINWL